MPLPKVVGSGTQPLMPKSLAESTHASVAPLSLLLGSPSMPNVPSQRGSVGLEPQRVTLDILIDTLGGDQAGLQSGERVSRGRELLRDPPQHVSDRGGMFREDGLSGDADNANLQALSERPDSQPHL
jgi:hypothetical protein